jgi:hypothetical protein
VAIAGAGTFLLAAVAGVLGNQLTETAIWAWAAFLGVLLLGAAVTGWLTVRSNAESAAVSTDVAQAARDARRPLYDEARKALGVLLDDFYAVEVWVSRHGTWAQTDRYEVLRPTTGHVLHTPPFGPLSRKLDESVAEGRRAAGAMEWSGIVPEPVSRDVGWVVERADQLHDTCKGAYVAKPERQAKWLLDAEQLRFVLYWEAINAMKDDLAHPAVKQ